MFQLVLGISLGILLLFVILLLITEVASTYPVWKHFESTYSSDVPAPSPKNKRRGNGLKIVLLVLTGIGILCLLVYLISYRKEPQEQPAVTRTEATTDTYKKLLSASVAGHPFLFRLQTKWENGRLYGNNTVTFHTDTVWQFAECRYYLLDKDGFLIRDILFSPEDFVFETEPGGRVRGLVNKFNMEMSLVEYQKIEKLQVVLDRKIYTLSRL